MQAEKNPVEKIKENILKTLEDHCNRLAASGHGVIANPRRIGLTFYGLLCAVAGPQVVVTSHNLFEWDFVHAFLEALNQLYNEGRVVQAFANMGVNGHTDVINCDCQFTVMLAT